MMQEYTSSRQIGGAFATPATRWRCAERRTGWKLTILFCTVFVAKSTAELASEPGRDPGPERSLAFRVTESDLTCSEVRLILNEKVKNIGRTTGATDNHDASSSHHQQHDVCSLDSICCTDQMESWLLMQSGTEMKKMLLEKMKSIKQTFATWTAKFDGFFQGLLERSKRSLYDLFNRSYGPFFEHNSLIFIQLYIDLKSHYRSDELNLEDSLDRFFVALLQRMFSLLNADLELTEEYLQCVAEHMELLRPFNEVPERLRSDIRRSFLAARAFVQGLSQGNEIIVTMAKQSPDDECSKTMAQMLFCQFCQGHSSATPCIDYCVTTVGQCLSQQINLQDDWTNYLRDLLRVADRLADPFNFESVVRLLDEKISEAVMNYQENSINVTTLVIQNCGNPPTKPRQRRELKSDDATSMPPEFIPSVASSQSSSSSSQPSSSSSPSSSSFPSSSSSFLSSNSSFSSSSLSSSSSSSLSSSSSPSSSDSYVSSSSPTTRPKSGQRQQQRKLHRQRQQQKEQQREGQPEQREEQQRLQQQGQPEQREVQHEDHTERQPEQSEEQFRQEQGQPEQQEEQRREGQHTDPPRRQQQQREEQPRQSKQQKEQRRQQRQRERLQEEQRRQQQEELARQQQLYEEQQRQPLQRQPQESDQYIEQPPVERQQQRQRVQQNRTTDSLQNRKQREPGQPKQRQQTKQQQRQQRPGSSAVPLTELEALLRDIRRKLEAVRTFWAGLPLSICGDVIAGSNNETTCWNGINLSRRMGVAVDRGYIQEPIQLSSVIRQQLLKLKVASDKLRQAYNGWSENEFDGSGDGLDFGSGTEVETPAPPFDEIRTNPPEVATSTTVGATKTLRRLTSGSRRTDNVAILVPVLLSVFVLVSH